MSKEIKFDLTVVVNDDETVSVDCKLSGEKLTDVVIPELKQEDKANVAEVESTVTPTSETQPETPAEIVE